MPGRGEVDYPWPAYDSDPGEDDDAPGLTLTQQDAGRYQDSLFNQPPPGRENAELLIKLKRAAGMGSVDDLIAWSHHNRGQGICTQGCGFRSLVGLRDGCRVWCPYCGVHTVCSAKDIATGNTPGPVLDKPPQAPRPGNMGG